MPKLITLLRRDAETGEPTGKLADRLVAARTSASGRRGSDRGRRRVLDIVDYRPSDVGWPDPDGYPAFAAVEESWFATDRDLSDAVARYQTPLPGLAGFHYATEEVLRRDDRAEHRPGTRVTGVKLLFLLNRRQDLDREAFIAYWHGVHGPIIEQRHAGLWKYVQDVVIGPLSPDAPPLDGIAELHYPSLDLARGNRKLSADERATAATDRANFLGESRLLVTGEYVLTDEGAADD